jgi:hypothetical protein
MRTISLHAWHNPGSGPGSHPGAAAESSSDQTR